MLCAQAASTLGKNWPNPTIKKKKIEKTQQVDALSRWGEARRIDYHNTQRLPCSSCRAGVKHAGGNVAETSPQQGPGGPRGCYFEGFDVWSCTLHLQGGEHPACPEPDGI